MSAPAALCFSKLFYPETEESMNKAQNMIVEKGWVCTATCSTFYNSDYNVYVNKISIQDAHLFHKFSIKMTVIKADETVSKGFSVPILIPLYKSLLKVIR